MVCDEEISNEEVEYLKNVAPPEDIDFFSVFINQNKADQITSIYPACKFLYSVLDGDSKQYLLELLLGMIIADNKVSISELHIIRFIADLFHFSQQNLDNIYKSLTGKKKVRFLGLYKNYYLKDQNANR